MPAGPSGFYVYALVDPRDGQPFYVGKGRDRRYLAHERDAKIGKPSAKACRIRDIWAAGQQVGYDMLASELDEAAAYALERETITKHRAILTNVSHGGGPLSTNPERQRRDEAFRTECRRLLDEIAIPKIVSWLQSQEPLRLSDPRVTRCLDFLRMAGRRVEFA